MQYYKRIKEIREDRDIKQKEIAEILQTEQRAEARGGKSYIAPTIHKADNQAYTRETLQPRACAALDRESAPRKRERATGRHENLPHFDNVRGLTG